MNMKKFKLCMFLTVIAVCLICFGSAMAAISEKEYCDKCCQDPSCEFRASCGCSSSSGGDDEEITIVAIPEDKKGGYYFDKDEKKYIQYRSWAECMNDMDDPERCGRLVTDDCETCLGGCKYDQQRGINLDKSCSEICKNPCSRRVTDSVTDPGRGYEPGEDKYGRYYFEGNQKKYAEFFGFDGCWAVLVDANECVRSYGYSCRYTSGFYMARLCGFTDTDCRDRVKTDYENVCK